MTESNCAQCGMMCRVGEYHPYAACLMFTACRDGNVVRANLEAIRRAPEPAVECIECLARSIMDDETKANVAMRDLLKDRPIYLMGREHINDKRKPLAELKFGMVSGLGVLFCMADTEAPIPADRRAPEPAIEVSPITAQEAWDRSTTDSTAALDDLPGMWDRADLIGGATDAIPSDDESVETLRMVLDGRISGRISEWPQLKPAIANLLRRLSHRAGDGRIGEDAARRIVLGFLHETFGDVPAFEVSVDGDDGWSFWVTEDGCDDDTTSYVHADGSVEWYGTAWEASPSAPVAGSGEERA